MTDVVLLHGLGQTPSAWDGVVAALPDTITAHPLAINVSGAFTFDRTVRDVLTAVERVSTGRVTLCGLSLGAMVAIQFAALHPHRVERLVLSGAQARPPRAFMAVQDLVMGILPARLLQLPGATKREIRGVLRVVRDMDLRPLLGSITAPTIVQCGSKDVVNLPAARQIAAAISNARLEIVPGVGHEWNVSHPNEFARRLAAVGE